MPRKTAKLPQEGRRKAHAPVVHPQQQSAATKIPGDDNSAAPTACHEGEPAMGLTLKSFVIQAWSILEPVSSLVWNWHLDLVCDYLTLIRDKKFKPVCGRQLEGIIFNVPPRTMKSL